MIRILNQWNWMVCTYPGSWFQEVGAKMKNLLTMMHSFSSEQEARPVVTSEPKIRLNSTNRNAMSCKIMHIAPLLTKQIHAQVHKFSLFLPIYSTPSSHILQVFTNWHLIIHTLTAHHHYHHHHQLIFHFLPRSIKVMDGCFPTALGRQSTISNISGPLA